MGKTIAAGSAKLLHNVAINGLLGAPCITERHGKQALRYARIAQPKVPHLTPGKSVLDDSSTESESKTNIGLLLTGHMCAKRTHITYHGIARDSTWCFVNS